MPQHDYRVISNLLNKLREGMLWNALEEGPYEEAVEADSCFIGGYVRPKNLREEANPSKPGQIRKNPWAYNDTGPTKKNVTAVVERGPHGRAFMGVAKSESASADFIKAKVTKKTTLYTDASPFYENLGHEVRAHYTVPHKVCFWTGEASTNLVESLHGKYKRAGRGVYGGRISDDSSADLFAAESAWRWTFRRTPTGDKLRLLIDAISLRNRTRFTGLWQRRSKGGN